MGPQMSAIKRFSAITLGLLLFQLCATSVWAADVYVVYSGRDGGLRNQVVDAMPRNLDVKTYNVDLLALADYSGKQKAVSKISRAGVVVIVGSRPMQILSKTKIRSNLIIVGNTSTNVTSSQSRIFVLTQGSGTNGLGSALTVSSWDDLSDGNKVRSVGVVLVDQSVMTISQAAALVAQALIG